MYAIWAFAALTLLCWGAAVWASFTDEEPVGMIPPLFDHEPKGGVRGITASENLLENAWGGRSCTGPPQWVQPALDQALVRMPCSNRTTPRPSLARRRR
jgi:hypothetical protein